MTTPVFPYETQGAYIKALDIVADIHHLLGRPTPQGGLGGQISQSAVELTTRIAEALQTHSSSERARRTGLAAIQAGTLASLLNILCAREEADERDTVAIKQKLSALADDLDTVAKSLAANKQLRQRVR